MQHLLLPPSELQDFDEDMKLRPEDKKWLSDEIGVQVKHGIAEAVDEFKPHGWKKAAFWIRQLGPIATSIAIIVTLLGITLSSLYYSFSNVREETKFRTTTEDALKSIKSDIADIRGNLGKQSVINHAALPLSEFKATLPDLRSAIATVKEQDVKVAPNVISDLQQKLLTAKDAPDFWPTAAQFINYRSQLAISDFQDLQRPTLPDCTDHDPSPTKVETISKDRHQFTVRSGYYDNCRLTLDSPQDDAKINSILESTAFMLTFRHCVVVYRGGEINLIVAFNNRPLTLFPIGHPESAFTTAPFTGRTLFFENCLFEIELDGQPPLPGQQFTQNLLATNGTKIGFTVSKASTHS
jgi:hypothetical protein